MTKVVDVWIGYWMDMVESLRSRGLDKRKHLKIERFLGQSRSKLVDCLPSFRWVQSPPPPIKTSLVVQARNLSAWEVEVEMPGQVHPWLHRKIWTVEWNLGLSVSWGLTINQQRSTCRSKSAVWPLARPAFRDCEKEAQVEKAKEGWRSFDGRRACLQTWGTEFEPT